MNTTPRAVIFDWDGTLADTAEASYRCYVKMFESFAMPFDRETYARTYSPNWYHTFRCLGLPQEHWEEADVRWLRYFAEETVELIEGAAELIAELIDSGTKVAIVTSGTRERVVREMHAHGLAFDCCVFGTDVANKKPHPEALLRCLAQLGVAPQDAVYVGDSAEDIEMARAAGVYSIAVPGPYPNRESLLAAGADLLLGSLRELAW